MDIAVIVAIIGSLGGLALGIVSLFRNKKADDKDEGKEGGVVLTELGYIKRGIDGIESRLEKQESKYTEVVVQLAAIKESARHAHKRIDDLERYNKTKS